MNKFNKTSVDDNQESLLLDSILKAMKQYSNINPTQDVSGQLENVLISILRGEKTA